MPRYAVYMSRPAVEYVTVYVDAHDEAAARDAALALNADDAQDWRTDFEAYGPTEVDAVDGPFPGLED
jgi:hypothetical protein